MHFHPAQVPPLASLYSGEPVLVHLVNGYSTCATGCCWTKRRASVTGSRRASLVTRSRALIDPSANSTPKQSASSCWILRLESR
jgi:hypothetical protein